MEVCTEPRAACGQKGRTLHASALVTNALQALIPCHELTVEYQPIVDGTGCLVRLEALARWGNAKSQLAADEFLPCLSRQGLMPSLTTLVLDRVCRQVVSWRLTTGQAPVIAVNVNASELKRVDFVGSVLQTLEHYQLPASALMFEVTEAERIDVALAAKPLSRLRSLGAAIALDDFGTGYASLAALGGLPLDEVKLDRSFITGIPGEPRSEGIVRNLVQLCAALEIDVVAEGVERREQLEWLLSIGVGRFQGFYFASPAPACHWTAQLGERMEQLVAASNIVDS